MAEDKQLILLQYMMTSLPERQIMTDMKKTDFDRYNMNFAYQSDKSKEIAKDIWENMLGGYFTIGLAREYLVSRYIIRETRYKMMS